MKNILLIGWLLILNYQLLFAVEDLRRCVKNDLIGTWTVTHKIFLNESLKKEYSHLLMPVQILMYRSDNKLR